MAELTVKLDLSFGKRSIGAMMAALMIFASATEVASESVTLTTYYPAPSGVYSQMITTGNTYLARDGGYVDVGNSAIQGAGVKMTVTGGTVGIGTSAPSTAYVLDVNGQFHVNGAAWAALIQSGSASAYFAHSGGYGAYIDAGGSANSGTYALDVNRSGAPYLFVRGDGYTGIGTAGPTQQLDVAGGVGAYGYLPHYQNWAAYGTGDGGAAIYNDNNGYRALMIVGNSGAGGQRRVRVWDSLSVEGGNGNGTIALTDASCAEVQYNINGVTTCAAAGFGGPSYVTVQAGVISSYVSMPYYTNPAGQQQGGLAPMLCCTCPSSGCPL